MTEVRDIKAPEKRESAFETIYRYTSAAIPPYQEVLKSDAEDKISSLGSNAKERLNDQIRQLEILKVTLAKVKEGQQFKQVVKSVKLLEREDNPRQTFTARLAPANEGFLPKDPSKPQIQLSLHSNISAYDPETVSEAYHALGLTRPPNEALEKLFRQATEQMVNINTVAVFIDPEAYETRVIPYGGITFRWRKGEDYARVGGFTYVGLQPHNNMEIFRTVPLADFAVMQGTVLRLSGYSPLKPKKG